ncbi:MAG TPA: MmgE/PrpD family protein, partial [Longimicrobiales bacterium]|nr:MmgE/PrpD family protein [Longimicrobiales bacterium]
HQAAPTDVTRTLARYLVASRPEDLPEPVRREARRTFTNWFGCAVGGSNHETLDIAVSALLPFAGPGQATILGRAERADILNAALLNGMSSHVLDYDDTHLKTVIHPAGPVASAILALSEYRPVSGRDFQHALVLGVETECRIGNAVYPAHYDRGWHITGTAGVFGAAAASGKLLGLSEQQMTWALGLAAAQPVGLREMFGTMTKSYHPGRAAQNGLTSALLAARNFTSTDVGIEGKSGWAHVLSTEVDYAEITDGLGDSYEILLNSYKPFPCGIVLHPTIDACLQLRAEHRLTPDQIERVDLSVHPLVLELTGKKTPQTGLEGKFSVYFAAAVALVAGAAGVKQFSDATVRDPVVVALRDRVVATVDPAIREEQVRVVLTLRDGRQVEKFIEHAVGSVESPMSDAALEAKFLDLADGVLPPAQARAVLAACWKVDETPSVADIARSAARG